MNVPARPRIESACSLGSPGRLGLLLFLLGAAAIPVEARTVVRVPPSFRSWTIQSEGLETTVTQIYVPLTTSLALGSRADLVLSGAGGFSSVEPDSGPSESLNGPADAQAQLFVRFLDDRVMLQGGVNAPTGRRELSAEEFGVARLLGHPLLGFRLKRYGEGLDFNGGAAAAVPVRDGMEFGAGASYTAHGKYPLLEDQQDYEPGSEVSLSAGLDLHEGEIGESAAALRLDGSYRIYGTDQIGGQDVYAQGDQTELEFEARVGSAGPRANLSARGILQADHTLFRGAGNDSLFAGDISSLKMQSGRAILLQGGFDVPLGSRLRAGVDGEWTHFGGSDVPGYDGNAFGGGPTLRLGLGTGGWLLLGGRILTGTITGVGDAEDTELSGFHLMFGFHWRAES